MRLKLLGRCAFSEIALKSPVIDAKYTSRINQRHQDGVRKYNEIRSADDDRPVVMQVWPAHPSEDGITSWDEAVDRTAVAPSRPHNEVVNGTIGVMPPIGPPAAEGKSPVNEVLLVFATGILAYLNVKSVDEVTRAS